MKIMFASDIHGSAYYCRKMLDIYSESGAGRLVFWETSCITVPAMTFPGNMPPRK